MYTPMILGIAGGTGSGKTSVAREIARELTPGAVHVDSDSYYKDQSGLTKEERLQVNYDHPEAIDTLLLLEHLQTLKRGQAIEKPVYDFANHARTDRTLRIESASVIIVEGILVLAIPELRDLFDIKVFVDTADDIRLMRRIRRDLEHRGRTFSDVRAQYYRTVRPMHLAFVEPSKAFADVAIPEGGENRIAIEVVSGHLRALLKPVSMPNFPRTIPRTPMPRTPSAVEF